METHQAVVCGFGTLVLHHQGGLVANDVTTKKTTAASLKKFLFNLCLVTHDASMGLVYLPTFTIEFNQM